MDSPPLSSTRTTMMEPKRKHILELPEELTEMLLLHVREAGSSKDFWNCLRTCRDWHRIGLGVHGQLDHTVSAIVESQHRRSGLNKECFQSNIQHTTDFDLGSPSMLYVSELRSLTIHVRHARMAAPFAPIPGRNMFDSIVAIFERTRKLSTFSLKFASDGWDFPHNDVPAIPQSQLARLVTNLPSTVVNLEFDTAAVDIAPTADLLATGKWHLCYQLGNIVSRLRHLRLRVGHVCRHILGPHSNPQVLGDAAIRDGSQELNCGKTSTAGTLEIFTVWLPSSEDARVLYRLLHEQSKPPNFQKAVVTVIRKEFPTSAITRLSPYGPHESPIWAARHSYSDNTSIHRSVHVHKMNKMVHSAMLPSEPVQYCHEHELLTTTLRRQFQMGGDVYPKSDFPYIGEWILEDICRWAQAGHLGARYPAMEANSEDKPFWRKPILWHPPTLSEYMTFKNQSITEGSGLWACLFPACPARCDSLNHLRGHQLYAHPASPHTGQFQGAHPCPSVGCDRIGYRAYTSPQELEKHLLQHHIHPCTRTK